MQDKDKNWDKAAKKPVQETAEAAEAD
jgi:hypothetical protein